MTAQGGSDFHHQRSWPVWSNQVQHRVDVEINLITDGLRILVDGVKVASRSGWKVALGTSEVPFEVDGRQCLLVLRQEYGAAPDMDVYSDGRSVSTGAPLATRRLELHRSMPSLIRLFLIFLPLIGIPSLLRPTASGRGPGLAGGVGAAIAGVVLTIVAGWIISRWYAREPAGRSRHLVPSLIVAGAYLTLFAIFFLMLSLERA